MAKVVVCGGFHLESYGNQHDLKWPVHPGGRFVWVPRDRTPDRELCYDSLNRTDFIAKALAQYLKVGFSK